ncbi:hypothetical protein E2C01_056779 [Portunus trituberculatus]|uniref:Uncharacterized protein n=1 Tax=Portunus trituberculatus TaxID=210409 RepID=A0A5B7GYP3_PORTR|nr:hypothetical protein [Portunus trituberculatus]
MRVGVPWLESRIAEARLLAHTNHNNEWDWNRSTHATMKTCLTTVAFIQCMLESTLPLEEAVLENNAYSVRCLPALHPFSRPSVIIPAAVRRVQTPAHRGPNDYTFPCRYLP